MARLAASLLPIIIEKRDFRSELHGNSVIRYVTLLLPAVCGPETGQSWTAALDRGLRRVLPEWSSGGARRKSDNICHPAPPVRQWTFPEEA